jgi:phosphomannomutase
VSGVRIASISGLRGIVGNGLDPAAVAEFAAAYGAGLDPHGAVYVGHDGRRSATTMTHAVAAGLSGVGCDVCLVGPIATPTLGRLVRKMAAAGGVMISASHNPPEYNGLKFFQPRGSVLGPEQGRAVLDRFTRRDLPWMPYDLLGPIEQPYATWYEGHVDDVLLHVDAEAIRRRGFRVFLDGCHGGGGPSAVALLRELGCDVRALGTTPDGFYDHPPEPTAENLAGILPLVPASGAAVGFVQDPDADRLALIDEAGRYVGEELTLALATRQVLETTERPGPVVANLSSSRLVDDIAAAHGVPVIRTPVGEIHVVEAMVAHDATIGGEGNGGVIHPALGWTRDSLAGIALVLDLMARTGEPLSGLVDALPRYAMIKTKFDAAGPLDADTLAALAAAYPDARADTRDGLRLDWPDRWVHARGSNTEPIVRVIAEARDPEAARRLAEEVGRRVAP